MAESHPIPSHPLFKNLTGRRFGKLSVISYAGRVNGAHSWNCQCDCGGFKVVNSQCLAHGLTASCGCLMSNRHASHHMTSTKEYRAWCHMKERCYRPACKEYRNWGARGIKVCDRWLNSFENFFADVGPAPSARHSLDRFPNAEGNYEPGNCRWATQKMQMRNTRETKFLTYHSIRRPLREWAEMLNVSPLTLWSRVNRGWPDDEVIGRPFNDGRRLVRSPVA